MKKTAGAIPEGGNAVTLAAGGGGPRSGFPYVVLLSRKEVTRVRSLGARGKRYFNGGGVGLER